MMRIVIWALVSRGDRLAKFSGVDRSTYEKNLWFGSGHTPAKC